MSEVGGADGRAPDVSIYDREILQEPPVPVEIVESEVDLYYRIAVEMIALVRENNAAGRPTVCIVPVGPTFQYRRFAWLCDAFPTDLSNLHLFFMDEYVASDGRVVPVDSSLSFAGFVQRELLERVDGRHNLDAAKVRFPDPSDPAAYDRAIEALGWPDLCVAGVGINGHLAFNEPPSGADAPSRVVDLTRETITINSNTAMGGAWEQIPPRAVTVGMRAILASRRLRIYLNRPWQSSVLRKILFGAAGPHFPASFSRNHPDATITVTPEVARKPAFALK